MTNGISHLLIGGGGGGGDFHRGGGSKNIAVLGEDTT